MPVHPDKESGKRALIALVVICFIVLLALALMGVGIDVPRVLVIVAEFLVNSQIAAMLVIGVSLCVTLVAWVVYALFRVPELMVAVFVLMGIVAIISLLFLAGDMLGVAGSVILTPNGVWIGKLYREKGADPPPTVTLNTHEECPYCKCG